MEDCRRASKRNSQIGQGGSQEASGAGSAEGSKAAELAKREAAEQERRRPLAPLERMVRERLSDIWVKYGLSKERLATMLEKQEWKCAICGEEFKLLKFSVDHSHLPPFKVRGLLCHRCNLRIGGWDDPKFAQSAAFYLKVPGVNSAKRGTAMDGRKKSATITPIKSREINQVDDLSTEEQEGDASVGSPGKTEESAGLSDFEEPKTAPEPLPQIPNLDQPTGTSFQPPPDPGLSALEELLKASETDFSLDKDSLQSESHLTRPEDLWGAKQSSREGYGDGSSEGRYPSQPRRKSQRSRAGIGCRMAVDLESRIREQRLRR